jgi:hypothetical protein
MCDTRNKNFPSGSHIAKDESLTITLLGMNSSLNEA